jgi:2-oxoisovalerate dehydrogenase E1 component alpha subunit
VCARLRYAISTGTAEQYKSDGIGPRALSFGIPTIRVDGNDVMAVFAATKRARELALTEGTPVMIEAMTYRIGAHSTSDDDSKYRTHEAPEEGWDNERAYWEARSPIVRFGRYLLSKGWFNVQLEEQLRKQARAETIATLNRAQAYEKPAIKTLFTDVNDELPWNLEEQQSELKQHLETYKEQYLQARTVTQKQLDTFDAQPGSAS